MSNQTTVLPTAVLLTGFAAFAPIISWGILTALALPSITLFILWRKRDPIEQRGVAVCVFGIIFLLIYYMFLAVDLYFKSDPALEIAVSCHFITWITVLFYPLGFGPYILRGLRLYILHTSGRLMVQSDDHSEHSDISKRQRFEKFFVFRMGWLAGSFYSLVIIVSVGLFFVFVAGLIYATRSIPQPYNIAGNQCLPPILLLIAAEGGLTIGFVTIMVYLLWFVKDGYSFKIELQIGLILCTPLFVLWALGEFNAIRPDSSNFVFAGVWVAFLFTIVFPLTQAFWMARVARQKEFTEISDSDSRPQSIVEAQQTEMVATVPTMKKSKQVKSVLAVYQILQNPAANEKLLQLAVQCFCAENVLFCNEVAKFRETVQNPDISIEQQIIAAKKIFGLYIEVGSRRQININSGTFDAIVASLDNLSAPINLFDQAELEVMDLIYLNLLPRWKTNAVLTPV